jgi:hypothetical protein
MGRSQTIGLRHPGSILIAVYVPWPAIGAITALAAYRRSHPIKRVNRRSGRSRRSDAPDACNPYERLGVDGKLVADQLGHSLDVIQNVCTQSAVSRRQIAVNELKVSLSATETLFAVTEHSVIN